MRIPGLDVLRGIAILLVLCRHGSLPDPLSHFGWLGVDLFFVISGFLVSGLLFKEYLHAGKINAKRFLIRRGFKIYPAFYFFMIFSICLRYFQTGNLYPVNNIAAEFFFVQNYFAGIWTHSWSLAVEEHFYFALALFALVAAGTNLLSNKKTVIAILLSMLLISFLLRLYVSWPHRNDATFTFTQTHLRADGLIIGVLVSYLFHFTGFFSALSDHRKIIFLIAAACLLPGFFYDGGGMMMNTAGLTLVNAGFGLFTWLSVHRQHPVENGFLKAPDKLIRFIGRNSYSIYLWHLVAMEAADFIFTPGSNFHFIMFFILSVTLGIFMTYLIEKPFLRWRDRHIMHDI